MFHNHCCEDLKFKSKVISHDIFGWKSVADFATNVYILPADSQRCPTFEVENPRRPSFPRLWVCGCLIASDLIASCVIWDVPYVKMFLLPVGIIWRVSSCGETCVIATSWSGVCYWEGQRWVYTECVEKRKHVNKKCKFSLLPASISV
jgi:hypothetical protein